MNTSSPSRISIIVPLYFRRPDAPGIPERFAAFFEQFRSQGCDDLEIFLSDSGPAQHQGHIEKVIDDCLLQYPEYQEKVTYYYEVTGETPLSRGAAMNLGIQRTTGDILLFLHADCRLPVGGLSILVQLFQEGVRGGGFLKRYTDKKTLSPLLVTEQYLNSLRTKWGRHLVGTNAIFLHRELAEKHPYQGDFLEDVEMSDWMRAHIPKEQWGIIEAPMLVSAQKYYKLGVWRAIMVNASVMGFHRVFDVEPMTLKSELYHRSYSKNPAFWLEWGQTVFDLFRNRKKYKRQD